MPSDTMAAPASAETQATEAQASPTQATVRSVYVQAFAALRRGGRQQTVGELQKNGLDAETASKVVDNVENFTVQARAAYRQAGLKSAGIGALWCIGGIVVTAVTYAGASGGGTYFVAWGAVLFGAVQALRGLAHSAKQPSEDDLVRVFNL